MEHVSLVKKYNKLTIVVASEDTRNKFDRHQEATLGLDNIYFKKVYDIETIFEDSNIKEMLISEDNINIVIIGDISEDMSLKLPLLKYYTENIFYIGRTLNAPSAVFKSKIIKEYSDITSKDIRDITLLTECNDTITVDNYNNKFKYLREKYPDNMDIENLIQDMEEILSEIEDTKTSLELVVSSNHDNDIHRLDIERKIKESSKTLLELCNVVGTLCVSNYNTETSENGLNVIQLPSKTMNIVIDAYQPIPKSIWNLLDDLDKASKVTMWNDKEKEFKFVILHDNTLYKVPDKYKNVIENVESNVDSSITYGQLLERHTVVYGKHESYFQSLDNLYNTGDENVVPDVIIVVDLRYFKGGIRKQRAQFNMLESYKDVSNITKRLDTNATIITDNKYEGILYDVKQGKSSVAIEAIMKEVDKYEYI